jgi:hypothetical protein
VASDGGLVSGAGAKHAEAPLLGVESLSRGGEDEDTEVGGVGRLLGRTVDAPEAPGAHGLRVFGSMGGEVADDGRGLRVVVRRGGDVDLLVFGAEGDRAVSGGGQVGVEIGEVTARA